MQLKMIKGTKAGPNAGTDTQSGGGWEELSVPQLRAPQGPLEQSQIERALASKIERDRSANELSDAVERGRRSLEHLELLWGQPQARPARIALEAMVGALNRITGDEVEEGLTCLRYGLDSIQAARAEQEKILDAGGAAVDLEPVLSNLDLLHSSLLRFGSQLLHPWGELAGREERFLVQARMNLLEAVEAAMDAHIHMFVEI